LKKKVSTGFYLPYDRGLVQKSRELRKDMTQAERKLWYDYLAGMMPRVLRQRPIGDYIVDFYCPSARLVIEIDGDTHFTPKAEHYDLRRTETLLGYGLRVIRFTNSEVLEQFEEVCRKIDEEIPPTPLDKGGKKVPESGRSGRSRRLQPSGVGLPDS